MRGGAAGGGRALTAPARSETRLLDVLEGACGAADFACHRLLEQSEEHVERWWFHE